MTKAKRIDHQVIKQSFHIKFQNIRSREIADDDDDGGGEDKFMSPVEKSKKESDDADRFAKNLKTLTASRMNDDWQIPVVKTVAIRNEGVEELLEQIQKHYGAGMKNERKAFLLAEKVWKIIAKGKMKSISRKDLYDKIESHMDKPGFNVYDFAKNFSK